LPYLGDSIEEALMMAKEALALFIDEVPVEKLPPSDNSSGS
jgi:predicted RNase H-like HicB family nuclease